MAGCRGRKRRLLPATPALLGDLANLDGCSGDDSPPDKPAAHKRGALEQIYGGNDSRPIRKRRATQFFGF